VGRRAGGQVRSKGSKSGGEVSIEARLIDRAAEVAGKKVWPHCENKHAGTAHRSRTVCIDSSARPSCPNCPLSPTSNSLEQSQSSACLGMIVLPPGCCGSHLPTSSTIPWITSHTFPSCVARLMSACKVNGLRWGWG
jgi:hypothetical protein